MVSILAAPQPGIYEVDRVEIWVDELQTALNRAQPGDRILLLPGTYSEPVVLQSSGKPGMPITITAHDPGQPPLLDGQRKPEDGRHAGIEPLDGDFAFIKLFQAEHIVLEHLKFDRCWPSVMFFRAAQHITVRKCEAERGRFFVYARQLAHRACRDILIEQCVWIQDPEYDMWEGRVDWGQVKASPGYRDFSHFNGAFFGSYNIEGRLTIRDCDIRHAFNAIRMDMDAEYVTRPMGGGPIITRNKDVAIYRNKFSFVRDNAVEPETGAQNWYVVNNAFYNLHAVFSSDLVAMRDVFFIGNTVLNDRRPGKPGVQKNQGGKVFKFFSGKGRAGEVMQPRKNFWSLFNSVQSRTTYAKMGVVSEWNDYYTLLGLWPQHYPESLTKKRKAFKIKKDLTDRIKFEGMLCTEEGFPDVYKSESFQNCQGGFDEAFALREFSQVPYAALGGWDGALEPHSQLPDLKSQEVRIRRKDGAELVFRAGLTPGAKDVSVFALSGWPFDEMATSAAASS